MPADKLQNVTPSVEEIYLNKGDAPSSIYFEVAALSVAKMTPFLDFENSLSAKLGEDAQAVVRNAQQSYVSTIATRAAYADFSAGNDTELQKLIDQIRGL